MDDQFESLGIWLDFPGVYQTITPQYIEAAWCTLLGLKRKECWNGVTGS